MSGKLLILLNAPPRSGKDTSAAALLDLFPDRDRVAVLRFSALSKVVSHDRYGMPDLPHDAFEDSKDTPNPLFGGLTPRQAYVETGKIIRQRYGEDVGARDFVQRLLGVPAQVVIAPDVGLEIEADLAADAVGRENTILFRIHTPGTGFHDRRTWVHPDGVETHDISGRSIPRMTERICALAAGFIEKRLGRAIMSCPPGRTVTPPCCCKDLREPPGPCQ